MKKGLTLLELMITVCIIGIIAIIIAPRMGLQIENSRSKITQQNLSNLRLAIAAYHSDWEVWPPSQNFTNRLVPEYIKEIPVCLLRRTLSNNETSTVHFDGSPSPNTCPNHGGWRYYAGTGTIIVNSAERDHRGDPYTDY